MACRSSSRISARDCERPQPGFRVPALPRAPASRQPTRRWREAPARRTGAARPLHHARVRHDLRHHHRVSRRGQGHPQPMEPAAHAWRFLRRLGGGRCRGRGAAVNVVRWRRLDPHPRMVLRAGRIEGLARTGAAAAGTQRIRHAHQHRWRCVPAVCATPQPSTTISAACRTAVPLHKDGCASGFLSGCDRAGAWQVEDRPVHRAIGPWHRHRSGGCGTCA